MTQAGHSMSKKNKRLILSIFASFLLVATIIAISMGINSHKNSTKNAAAHALLVTSGNSDDPHAAILNTINATIDAINSKKIEADKILNTKKPEKKTEECSQRNQDTLLLSQLNKALTSIKQLIENTKASTVKDTKSTSRKLKDESDGDEGWPGWLSVTDRRLFQSSLLTPDVVVAADGSGKYRTVSAAAAAAPKHSSQRYIY
ncbi:PECTINESTERASE [Salix koriyanagi]|uniref:PECTINESTERASE n=1 Tax=Salix koriyanagi TaxID=2511006 RepID=A0A9Q0T0V0_9ROSI|nr:PECTINESTERASE [Salix koriyanagi]